MANQALALGGATAQPGQVGLGRRLVDEDQPGWIEPTLASAPLPPGLRDVRPVLFGRIERLFLYVSPSLVTTQWTAATVQLSSRRAFISARVKSGSWAMSCFSLDPCSGISRAFRPEKRCRGRRSPVLVLCSSSFFTMPSDTRKRFATSSLVPSLAS
jgi:hypothetical protein